MTRADRYPLHPVSRIERRGAYGTLLIAGKCTSFIHKREARIWAFAVAGIPRRAIVALAIS